MTRDYRIVPLSTAFHFAFSHLDHAADYASIYAYVERPYGIKGCSSDMPRIEVLHPYTKSHRRHFQQQSYYSVCYRAVEKDKDLSFACHEDVFFEKQEFTEGELGQDIFFKINIPIQSEESLMKTTAFREIKMIENP